MSKGGYIYIVSNPKRTVFYVGVIAYLYRRITDHKNGNGSVFTIKYKCIDLIYFEFHSSIVQAIEREKKLKKWRREWKENLVKKVNPEFKDLYFDLDPFVDPLT